MDINISRWIVETFGESKAFAEIFKYITYAGSKWVVIALIILALILTKNRKLCVSAVLAVGLVYVFNDYLFKELIARDRPFIADPSLTAICDLAKVELPSGYSMASGHAAVSMAFAMSVMLYNWKLGIPAVIYSLLVGLSRICLCVHYFTDVLAGFGFGILFAVIVYFVIKLTLKIYNKRRESHEKVSSSN